MLNSVDVCVNFREIEVLPSAASVDVNNVGTSGLEVCGGIVRFGDKNLREMSKTIKNKITLKTHCLFIVADTKDVKLLSLTYATH